MRLFMLAVLVILFWALGMPFAFANESRCQEIKQIAQDLQLERQYGNNTLHKQYDARTHLEYSMKNSVWQQPQFRAEDRKQRRAKRFGTWWYQDCKAGYFNDN